VKKILVWHQGALGDLILSLPSLHAIKISRKDRYLHLVSRGDLADIIFRNRLADEVTLNEAGIFSDLFTGGGAASPDLSALLRDADEAFVFMRRRDPVFMKNLYSYVPRVIYIETVPPEDRKNHVAGYQTEQLKPAGINVDIEMPVLDSSGGLFPAPTEKRIVTVHPGSGGRKKCWPLDKFLDLAALLHSLYSPAIRLIFGPAEDRTMVERAHAYLAGTGVELSIYSDISVSEAASLIKGSSLFIGNDSGMTHLASALGTPVIALFGPTDHRVWGPLGENVYILRSLYPCSPCREDEYRTCPGALCMENLGTEKVLEVARTLLDEVNIRN